MNASQWSKKTWIWLSVVLTLAIVGSYFLVSNGPKDYPAYVSQSPAPQGTKAIYTYLNQNYDVEKWKHEPDLLTAEKDKQTLVMIEPFFTPDSTQMNQYIDYMEAGNTILLFKNNPNGLFDLDVEPTVVANDEATTITNWQGEDYEGVIRSPMRLVEAPEDNILLEDSFGTIALERSFGKGTLIVANSPNWLTNQHIIEENHVELLMSLFNEGTSDAILIDEYIHGSGHAPSIVTLYPKWLLVLTLQISILLVLWLWYRGKRFGPIYTPREAIVRFSNEQTTALASWFQRGKRYQDALTLQADYLKLELQEKWGIPYRKTWEECSDLLAKRSSNMSESEANHFTTGLVHQLYKQSLDKKEFLMWSENLDQLQREVEENEQSA